MLAAENDVIPGAKVGGIGDVIRDLPAALAAEGARVTVVIPAYGKFHTLPGAVYRGSIAVPFMTGTESVSLHDVFIDRDPGVRYCVLHHPGLAPCGIGQVYCNDDTDQPFATDATRFALFSAAAAVAIRDGLLGTVDRLHLHDWHCGVVAILRACHPSFDNLKAIPCVFSIHNLALQGVRPRSGHESSLQSWFPDLSEGHVNLADPRWPDCANPMAAGIRLSDKVHTVSPSYAQEVLQANAPDRGFHGGEGLEADLQAVAREQRLLGILNGIDYTTAASERKAWPQLVESLANHMLATQSAPGALASADYLAHQRLLQWQQMDAPQHVLTSIGRLTDQKLAILLDDNSAHHAENPATGQSTLELMLTQLATHPGGRGVFILLGSGDATLEAQCQALAARCDNFLFINRYAQNIADELYASGDLFVMPSSFEPCGISQMQAMRHQQPCLVHAVGGLIDTVQDDKNGFSFRGDSMSAQSQALLARLHDILTLRTDRPHVYRRISEAAGAVRFDWSTSAKRYLEELYA